MGWASGANVVREIAEKVSKLKGLTFVHEIAVMKAVCEACTDEDWDTHYEAMGASLACDEALRDLGYVEQDDDPPDSRDGDATEEGDTEQ